MKKKEFGGVGRSLRKKGGAMGDEWRGKGRLGWRTGKRYFEVRGIGDVSALAPSISTSWKVGPYSIVHNWIPVPGCVTDFISTRISRLPSTFNSLPYLHAWT